MTLKDDIRGGYRRWWIKHVNTGGLANGKLRSYKEFKTMFATSPYLNTGPPDL